MKLLTASLAAVFLIFTQIASTTAQGFPPSGPPQVQPISNDPVLGPICAGPMGPGRCQDVQQFLLIEQVASQIQLQPISFDPMAGPICAGPLGPGPCIFVRRYLAMQQLAVQQFPLQHIGSLPGGAPLCMGPLGPGPCDAIRNYLMQQQPGAPPVQNFDPSRVQLVNNTGTGTLDPMCSGPLGPTQCSLIGQMSLDRFSGQVPTAGSFGVASGGTPQKTAIECARRAGIDVVQFAGCAGQQVILPPNQQKVLDCAVSSRDSATFANCAAPHLGIELSDSQRTLAQCAMRANGDRTGFLNCAGGNFLNRNLSPDEQAVLNCAASAQGDAANFANCSASKIVDKLRMSRRRLPAVRFHRKEIRMAL
jgi:hypothetical protein